MIETPDLVLRQGCQEDWQDLYENLWQYDSVFCFMFSKATPSADAARKKTMAYVQMQKEVPTEYFVYEKMSGKCIGIAGLKKLSPNLFTVTDIAIGPSFWGKSYGKQVLTALSFCAFEIHHANALLYCCFEDNLPSQRLALSCGFAYTHSQIAELQKDGKDIFLMHFRKEKQNEENVNEYCS